MSQWMLTAGTNWSRFDVHWGLRCWTKL